MKLNDGERRFIAAAELHANAPLHELAARADMSANSIRYLISKLQGHRIITPVPFIDLYPLGYTDFVIFFSLSSHGNADERTRFLDMLERSPLVTWIGELGGQFQYGAAIFVHHVSEFLAFLETMTAHTPTMIMKKSVRLTKRFTRYNRTYLCPEIPKESFSFGNHERRVSIDARDEKILHALTQRPTINMRHMAEFLGMPLSTLQYRIRQLEEKGVLLGHIFGVDPARIGATLYNLHVFTNGVSAQAQQHLRAWANAHPHVVHFIECVGEWDYEIGVEVENAQEIIAIVADLHDRFGATVSRIDTIPIFRNRKYIFFRPSMTLS